MRNGFCHFWMSCLEMLLPFCSKPNHPIMDVVEKLHGDIYVLLMPRHNDFRWREVAPRRHAGELP